MVEVELPPILLADADVLIDYAEISHVESRAMDPRH
jgi:hypothetical protein